MSSDACILYTSPSTLVTLTRHAAFCARVLIAHSPLPSAVSHTPPSATTSAASHLG